MAKAAFGIVFLPEDGKLHANGNDDVEFMLSANKGEPLKPLSKVASGRRTFTRDAGDQNCLCRCGRNAYTDIR